MCFSFSVRFGRVLIQSLLCLLPRFLKPRFLVLCAVLLLSGCASLVRPNYSTELAQLRAGEYELDQEHAYVHFSVVHLGLSKVVGRFNSVDAELDFDPEALDAIRMDGTIDMSSIDLNNESLERTLSASDWFDVKQFPEASFKTTNVLPGDDNRFVLTGELTLRGVTEVVSLAARFNGGADNILTGRYTLGFEASGRVKRSEFGVDKFAALVSDEVDIEIHAEFQKRP